MRIRFARIRGVTSWNEIHGWYSVVEKHAQTMLQLLDLVCVVCVGKPGQPEKIVDIPVPQIVEEVAEVSKILDCVQQYPEPLL